MNSAYPTAIDMTEEGIAVCSAVACGPIARSPERGQSVSLSLRPGDDVRQAGGVIGLSLAGGQAQHMRAHGQVDYALALDKDEDENEKRLRRRRRWRKRKGGVQTRSVLECKQDRYEHSIHGENRVWIVLACARQGTTNASNY